MKIKDLKIGAQLIMGFSVILVLIVVLGYISLQSSEKIAKQTTDLYTHPLKVRRAIGELKADVLAIRREMKELIITGDQIGIESIQQEIGKFQTDAIRQLEVMDEFYLGPKVDVETIYNEFAKWNAIRDETIRLKRMGKVDEASARSKTNGVGVNQAELVLKHVQVIDNFALNKGDELYLNAISLDQALKKQMGFLTVGIFALTLLIIYILTRNIRSPLAELTSVAQRFKQGSLEARSQYLSTNEYGLLSAAFNDLADTVQTELTLNSQSAKLSEVMLSEDDAHRFSHSLLTNLLEQTNSQMGAVYLLNDEKTDFEHFECLGMNPEGCKPFSAIRFEGEFGTALATKKIQHIREIHKDTQFSFYTVSGKFTPHEIVTIPIVAGNETIAVISLATIKSFTEDSLRLLDNIIITLGARMDGILSYRKIVDISQKLESQNIELESQKSELYSQKAEVTEQNAQLEVQKNQLDEANRMKSSFLSNMSHELRTPLNSVIALSGVLNRSLEGKVTEEEFGYLDIIERNGKHLLSLINDILDLSRIEAGKEDMEITKFKVNGLLSEVVDLIEPQATEKKITLSYKGVDRLPEIESDYDKCRHILMNIVVNAVKFTEKGEVEITAETNAKTIHISIKDTGVGMEAEYLPHIFNEFQQADSSNSKKYGGTGLGLAIAKKFTELLGGNITVESTRGKGSKFTLSLPLQYTGSETIVDKQEALNSLSKPKTGKPIGIVNAKDKTILLVEDTEAIVIQMKDMLEAQGYNIIVARNGTEALKLIAQRIPDGVILDLMMPEVDGFEVLRLIREQESTLHLPVVILTAKYVTKEELSFLKHNGIQQLIYKGDINKEKLLDVVTRMVLAVVPNSESIQKKATPMTFEGTPVVLVVEDNADNMSTLKALLAGKCTVIEAENGPSGIELAQKHKPHLILMDYALPGMNGIEALKELRDDTATEQIPVIVVSASAMKGDRENFIAAGFNDYISKPIDNDLFEKVINPWLSNPNT